ncbi:MAG: UDP-3-O-acyl-N-acetylglucosamine deacetylase, partial [Hyphomicrobiales bacterium]
AAIGRQTFKADLSARMFRDELARARTFGFMKDVERLWASGHALGSSLENSVVIGDDDRIINQGGLRFVDEFVRHKALDAIGDQALAGGRILGCYSSYRGGHKLNALALQALLADRTAYEIVEMPSRRREIVRHSPLITAAVAAPAYGPQTL